MISLILECFCSDRPRIGDIIDFRACVVTGLE